MVQKVSQASFKQHNQWYTKHIFSFGWWVGFLEKTEENKTGYERVDKPPVDFFKRNMTTHFLLTKIWFFTKWCCYERNFLWCNNYIFSKAALYHWMERQSSVLLLLVLYNITLIFKTIILKLWVSVSMILKS